MKKYLLILFCSLAFCQEPNQMVTFTQAQSLGFQLNAGQSSVNSNECLTKSQALAKYNLDASAMSAYASNQLVPRSVWVTGADLTPPSYLNASVSYVSSTSSSLTGSWTGWTDNIGISHYKVVVQNYTTGIVEHTSANLSSSTSSYTATGLSGSTLYYYTCWAYDAAGNTSGLTFPYTTPPSITYDPIYYYKTNPCNSDQLYLGSDGYLYYYNNGYILYNGIVYSFVGPSQDVYNWYDWQIDNYVNGVYHSSLGNELSACGLY